MLEHILENKSLVNIVGFFLTSTERAYHISQLQKLLGRNVDRHLTALVKMGVLRSFAKKNQKFFMLSKRNKELPEMKAKILKLSKKFAEDELTKAIRLMPKIKVGVLCGVFAGNPEFGCDVLLAGDITKKRLDGFVKLAEKLAGQEINYALLEGPEFEMRKNIFDRFIKDVYENPHVVIKKPKGSV